MRICLLSTSFPPAGRNGIARQRHVLATELARSGHDVTVITSSSRDATRFEAGFRIEEVTVNHRRQPTCLDLVSDRMIAGSEALSLRLEDLHRRQPLDVIDAPLWEVPGLVASERMDLPVATWVQTTSAQVARFSHASHPGDSRLHCLERLMLERSAGVLGDSAISLTSLWADYGPPVPAPTTFVYLGLPAVPSSTPPPRDVVLALVVGRLEARKGTAELLETVAGALTRCRHLRIVFAGEDNSASDGFFGRHGRTYPDWFRERHPALAQRVSFVGPIEDAALMALYREADLVISGAAYESFGLTALETMRCGIPYVAYASGATPEIFPHGESDGAFLAEPGNASQLADNLVRAAECRELRQRVGAAGARHFADHFSSAGMATATVRFYESVLGEWNDRGRARTPIVHVMEALRDGDAVSTIARTMAATLSALGEERRIRVRHAEPELAEEVAPVADVGRMSRAHLIFHYWGYNSSAWSIRAARGKRALHYHGITPPHFFPKGSRLFELTQRGVQQLREILPHFDLLIADSLFGLAELSAHLDSPRPALVLHPVVEPKAGGFDRESARPANGPRNFLFVGRIASNKRQDLLVDAFDYYFRRIDSHSNLWLVGDADSDASYAASLRDKISHLPSARAIHLTGRVDADDLDRHYRNADVFLCASEHEGFCVPIAEAAAYGIPAVALAAGAVPETVGKGGILVEEWSASGVAEIVRVVAEDAAVRRDIIGKQIENLARFTAKEAARRVQAITTFLRRGETDPCMLTLDGTFAVSYREPQWIGWTPDVASEILRRADSNEDRTGTVLVSPNRACA